MTGGPASSPGGGGERRNLCAMLHVVYAKPRAPLGRAAHGACATKKPARARRTQGGLREPEAEVRLVVLEMNLEDDEVTEDGDVARAEEAIVSMKRLGLAKRMMEALITQQTTD